MAFYLHLIGAMTSNVRKYLNVIFQVLCWMTTASVIVFWLYKFSLNQDYSVIEYKKYHQDEADVYPMLSLCFKNPFDSDKIATNDTQINGTSYLEFINGQYFAPKMLDIDHGKIIMNISDYIDDAWIGWRNGSYRRKYDNQYHKKLFFSTFSGFWLGTFYHCYGLQVIPDGQVDTFTVLMNDAIFSNNRRSSRNFFTLLHYPNQLLRSMRSIKYSWKKRRRNSTYSMRFLVNRMEVVKRRNKRRTPCNENWKNHDDEVLLRHIQEGGCRAPYQNIQTPIPVCSNGSKIKKAGISLRTDEYGRWPPCIGMEKIIYSYEEADLSDTEWSGTGDVWIGLYFNDPYFVEVSQERLVSLKCILM